MLLLCASDSVHDCVSLVCSFMICISLVMSQPCVSAGAVIVVTSRQTRDSVVVGVTSQTVQRLNHWLHCLGPFVDDTAAPHRRSRL